MAKGSKKIVAAANDGINHVLLTAIANGNVTHVSQTDGLPLLQHIPPLIDVDVNNLDANGNAAVKLTAAGNEMVAAGAPNANAGNQPKPDAGTKFAIIANAVLPASKRGVGLKSNGRTSQYPFDQLEIGQTFFVPVSAETPDPMKTVSSTVSSANMRYRTETGETKQKKRAKRGADHKAVIENGQKVMETVTIPVYKQDRKFVIRPVKAGEKYGDWVADNNGVLVGRVALDAE